MARRPGVSYDDGLLLLIESPFVLPELLLLRFSPVVPLLADATAVALLFDKFAAPVAAVLLGAERALSNCCNTVLVNAGSCLPETSLIVDKNKVRSEEHTS